MPAEPQNANPQDPKATPPNLSLDEKVTQFKEIVSGAGVAMLTTRASSGHLHSRAMAPASKEAPKTFEFIANKQSGKIDEIENDSHVNVALYDKSSTNWASVAGKIRVSNDVARIKEIWNPMVSAWFGDLGDGKHDGTPDDPRVILLTVTPEEIHYWYNTRTQVGKLVDIAASAATGKVANPGHSAIISKSELSSL